MYVLFIIIKAVTQYNNSIRNNNKTSYQNSKSVVPTSFANHIYILIYNTRNISSNFQFSYNIKYYANRFDTCAYL